MNTYTVDKAKELIVMSNPLWNKYISMCGVYQCEGGKMYLASEDSNTRIRIDDNFGGVVVADGIEDGDTLKIEGFLNYLGKNQKTKDDKNVKAANVALDNSSFYLYLTPKKIECVERKDPTPIPANTPLDNKSCASAGCGIIILLIIICSVIACFTLL